MRAHEGDPHADPPRRIAFVITRSDAVGGAQIYVLELARALQEAGHVVRVLVGGEGPFVARLRDAKVPVTPIPAMIRAIDPRAELRAITQLLAELRRFDPELISAHSSKASVLGRVLGLGLRVPVVVTAHGWPLTPGKLSVRQHFYRAIEASSMWLVRRVISVSEFDRRLALEHEVVSASRITVVHNAVPDVEASLLAQPELAPPRIVMVARFEAPKDPLTAIAALERLRELDWRCELIGDGPMRPEVEAALHRARLEQRVDLLGTRDDVPARLATAQIFMLTSLREGFPLSVLEAMRAGLPVVASDVGGINEALTPECGTLVEPGSAVALADALAPLIRDPELRRQRGAAARARFLAEFQHEVHVRRTWAVFADALERGPIGSSLSARS